MTVDSPSDVPKRRWKPFLPLLLAGPTGIGAVAGLLILRQIHKRKAAEIPDTPWSEVESLPVAQQAGRQYDIFPRTWRARLLLALAFVSGLILVWALMVPPFLAYVDSWMYACTSTNCRWSVTRVSVSPLCHESPESCLGAQTKLDSVAQSSCPSYGPRICFVPLGQVDPGLVGDLVEYYDAEYGLDIGVLTPSAVPAEMVHSGRKQVAGGSLAQYMGTLFPADYDDPDVVLIGLTPLDLYAKDVDWRYEFGEASVSGGHVGVVSTYRMHFALEGWADDDLVLSRTRKMVTKYIGLMYYDLLPDYDPTSPMYGRILSVEDLDEMTEPLPVS